MRSKTNAAAFADGAFSQQQIFSDSLSVFSSSQCEVVTAQDPSCLGSSRSQQPSPRNPFKPKSRVNQLSNFDKADQASSSFRPGGLGAMNLDQLNQFAETLNSN